MKPTHPKAQQKLVDDFNRKCEVGQHVNVRLDGGEIKTTTTRAAAEVLGGHTAVVWLEGIAGAYLLSRVTVLPMVRR